MSEQELTKINRGFRNVFDDDDIEVEAGTTADDIEDWDSLEQYQPHLRCRRRIRHPFQDGRGFFDEECRRNGRHHKIQSLSGRAGGCEPLQIPPAAVSRFKFAVLTD